MSTTTPAPSPGPGPAPAAALVLSHTEAPTDKGLKSGALGLISNIVIGVASTAPAYSLAATLGLIVAAVGLKSPLVAVLAFVPMLLVSIGYSELNKADPDCGTTFTWGTRTFGPRVGWWGGWGIIASDVLVMASLAQVTGQYSFLLFNAHGIGSNPTDGWVLLVGLAFLAAMTYICYRGIEISARVQRLLLSVEVIMLVVFAVTALVRVAVGTAPAVHLAPRLSWITFSGTSFSTMVTGVLLMLFIYWGWDTSVSVNEETADSRRNPGLAAIISTVLLLCTYFIVTLAAQAYAGIGTKGIGLANPAHQSDVISVLGTAVFGPGWVGSVLAHLLVLMVLTSAAASTQTTILPTARTTLSMAIYKGIPDAFGRMHKKHLTPTVSTLTMGGISAVLYLVMNQVAKGNLIPDAVTAIGIWIAFYYGLTGFTCVWYYRKVLTRSARDLWMKGVLPLLGGLMLYFAMGWSIWKDWNYNNSTAASYTSWHLPFPPHSQVGGVFLIALVSALIGALCVVAWRIAGPAYFRGETLNRSTPTLVPEDEALPLTAYDGAAVDEGPGSRPGSAPAA
ncbi:MAG: APC family permease [Acidimicrobiales bacterium]